MAMQTACMFVCSMAPYLHHNNELQNFKGIILSFAGGSEENY
jgi:hypothetical protein